MRSAAQSRALIAFCKEKYPAMANMLDSYRKAVLAWKGPGANIEQLETMKSMQSQLILYVYELTESIGYEDKMTDLNYDFIRACTVCHLFYDGNESFDWTFISPPAMYGPGKRTGEYDVHLEHYLPLPEEEGDILPGISAPDLAIALADEAERKGMKWTHWTVTGSQSDDSVVSMYPKI